MTIAPQRDPFAVAWASFLEGMAHDPEPMRATLRRVSELPSYRVIPLEELVPHLRRTFAFGLVGLRERRLPAADEDLTLYEEYGAERARLGVRLEDMLHGWRVGLEASRAAAKRHAPPGPHREELLVDAIEIITAWSTAGIQASAAAHRRVELELARQEHHHLANLVRRLLFGGMAPAAWQGHLESHGLDAAGPFYAVRVRPGEHADVGAIEAYLGTVESAERPKGLVALIDGDVAGLVTSLPSETPPGVAVGVAGPVPTASLPEAFRLASRALEAAQALGRTGVVRLADVGLTPALLADGEVGAALVDRYVAPLEQHGRSGALVLDTVTRYLTNDCQVDLTAEQLSVHPNTVRNRVARFEQLAGTSLKHNESLVEAWWALRHRALTAPQA
jgi:hypothetical protein